MKKYLEPAREIPVKHEVDVLVVGGGPAGFSAAVNSARLGVKTMLIEQTGGVGGIATMGLMSHWTGETEGPFYNELLDKSKEREGEFYYYGERKWGWDKIINPEKLRIVMLEMIEESGAILQLYTFACDVIMDGNNIVGVITESKSGREAIMAKIVIDASGDGDIAAKAGAPFFMGREKDRKMQPVSVMFKVGGVDTSKAVYPGQFNDRFDLPQGELQELAEQELPHPAGHVLLYPSTLPDVVSVNMTNCTDIDGTKVEDLTTGEIICRKQITPIIRFLRKHVPGFENCYVISTSAILGVRETRHFIGEYTLTEEDILNSRFFDDWIVAKALFHQLDVHSLTGSGLDETGMQDEFPRIASYTIPYRCFLPKKIDSLLLAGRNISGTHLAHSNFRVMPICVNMGQGVGVAAALSVKEKVRPKDLNVQKIQKILIECGYNLEKRY